MAFKMFSTGLLLAFAGMCVCNPSGSSPSQYQPSAVSQASFQTGSAAVQPSQTKLEDVERDSLAAAFGQKTQPQSGKPSSASSPVTAQQQPQQPAAYQAVPPQQQYFLQPYQTPQQQFYVQPFQAQQYLAQPYQSLFDYSALQYYANPNVYNPGNQVYQQYYVPAAQPSAIPQFVTKQLSPAAQTTVAQQISAPATQVSQEYKQQQFAAPTQVPQEYKQQQFAAPAQVPQEYKQQQFAAPNQIPQEYKQQQFAVPVQAQQQYKQQQFAAQVQAQQEYKQQQFAAPAQAQQEYKQQIAVPALAQQEYKQQQFSAAVPVQAQQQYVIPAPAYQYVQQPAAAGPVDFSYVTRHPSAGNAVANFKVPAIASAAVQPQFQYSEVPPQYYQPQNYYAVPSAAAAAAAEQPRVQQSAKSQFSSGVKSTTPFPVKEPFAYKFESSSPPQQQQQQQQQQSYSTIKYTA